MLILKTVSSLIKAYPDREPVCGETKCASMLKNDVYSYQILYKKAEKGSGVISVRTVLPPELEGRVSVRYVDYVPCDMTVPEGMEKYAEHPKPGLMPDILRELPKSIWACGAYFRSLWVTVDLSCGGVGPGEYFIRVILDDGCESVSEFCIEVLDAELPQQSIPVTNWFHSDCLCNYYKVDFCSPEFWRIASEFVKTAVKNGINTILTPVFTPPLDTEQGGERLTAQLVDVIVKGGTYSFSFGKLGKWIDLCLSCGVKYFEISHLFTQWGCRFAPKVMAAVGGVRKRIFGWETPGDDPSYREFLSAFLPALVKYLKRKKIFERCFFHVSDEPWTEVADSYGSGADFVRRFIPEDKIIDALSDYDLYGRGLVKCPVVSLDHIRDFLDRGVKNLWGYYCCGQITTSNRFAACSSSKNRILGIQLFKYDVKGFLQWGYNFYNSLLSKESVDPYGSCTAGGWVPGGDPFVVYPGADGTPVESLRLAVFAEALRDMRALNGLLVKYSREEIVRMLCLDGLTFTEYSEDPEMITSVREKVNRMLEKV